MPSVITNIDPGKVLHSRRIFNQRPVPFTAGATETTEIERMYPIDHLRCRLVMQVDVSGTTAVISPFSILNLIQDISVIRNASEVLFKVTGNMLQMLHQVETEMSPYKVTPALTVGNDKVIECSFVIPISAAEPYFSLLDASERAGHTSLFVAVKWGAMTDAFTAGTIAVDYCRLEIDTVAIAGEEGARGGILFPYMLRKMDVAVKSITATQAEFPVDLNKGEIYNRFLLLFTSQGTPVDTIFNRAQFTIGSTVLQPRASSLMRAENWDRYQLQAAPTGFYVLDITEPGMFNQMQQIARDQTVQLKLDVTNQTDAKVWILSDRFLQPVRA